MDSFVKCPCGTGIPYHDCCGQYIESVMNAPTPEALMRSRYTAYSIANIDYITRTMKSPALDGFNAEEARQWAASVHWDGLQVLQAESQNNTGTVEFIARYSHHHESFVMHERSQFKRENGCWYYVSGIQPKMGRNEVCPCGSGKKYKKCCASSG